MHRQEIVNRISDICLKLIAGVSDATESGNELKKLADQIVEPCAWTPDRSSCGEIEFWHSECDQDWCFSDGTEPSEHGMKYCHGCGREIKTVFPDCEWELDDDRDAEKLYSKSCGGYGPKSSINTDGTCATCNGKVTIKPE